MIEYKAEVIRDPNVAVNSNYDGYGPRYFLNEDVTVVDHWVAHVLIDGIKADRIVRSVVTTEVTT